MSDDAVAGTLDVFVVDPATEDEVKIGEVELSEAGLLALVEADPEHDDRLRAAIAAINAKDAITELAPPVNGAARYAVSTTVTKRDDEAFFGALNRYMQKYYGYSLG
jgi:hypothetical protein